MLGSMTEVENRYGEDCHPLCGEMQPGLRIMLLQINQLAALHAKRRKVRTFQPNAA